MYRKHFGLNELPFTITPDTSFFFPHSSHQEALNTLLVAIDSGEGFIKVTGEVGTGKTLLCRKFLGALEQGEYVTAYIPNPYLQPTTLLLAIADELKLRYRASASQHHLLKLLTNYLIKTCAGGKRVVVCLDEAQAMPLETLESLRLLTNLETERRKLLQVVLFGQPELNARLDHPSVRQLKQRITFSCELRPFSTQEATLYIAHRLCIAGYTGPRLFAPEAVRLIQRFARGIPRMVNILAHKAMLAAFGEGAGSVNATHAHAAICDTESLSWGMRWRLRWGQFAAGMAVLAAACASAVVWARWS